MHPTASPIHPHLSRVHRKGRAQQDGPHPMTMMMGQTPEQKAEADKQFEASLATRNLEEQEKAKQRHDQREAIRNPSPEKRPKAMQQTMQEMRLDPATRSQFREQMMNHFTGALKDSKPDQRVGRSHTIEERRKMFQGAPPR